MNTLKGLLMAGVLALPGAAMAETYRASSWLPDNESTVVVMRWFTDQLEQKTDGDITFEVFSSGALMPPKSHLTGIGDGVVQLGFHTSGYTPSDVPIANALAGFGFISSDPVTIGAAWTDFVMHDDAQKEEFLEHGVVPMGGFSTPTYPIICSTKEPITELSQMEGLKVRSLGLIGKLVSDLGGVAVNIPAPEIYQALQTGQIDCAGIFPSYLTVDNSLAEVAKFSTDMKWTGSYNSPLFLINREFWSDLDTEDRATVFELAARAQARLQILYEDQQQLSFDQAVAEHGHTVVQPGESIQTAVTEWVENGVGDMAGVARDTYGIEDPEALFARFQPYVTKWEELIGGMDDKFDEDALTAMLMDNIYNTLDPAEYAVE
jgi:TRAP-type C4-dicarboxylate transport system substrate-binding protein